MKATKTKGFSIFTLTLLLISFPVVDSSPQFRVFAQTVIFGPQEFTRTTGAPRKVEATFSVQNTNAEYTLQIQNGNQPVSSAVIELNGVEVAGPSDFNPHRALITKLINLKPDNRLAVELRGRPGSSFTVSITRRPLLTGPPKLFTSFNQNDPLLLRADLVTGEVIEWFGDKNSAGLPEAVRAVRVHAAMGGTNEIQLDDRARPIAMRASNGLTLLMNWQSDTSIRVTVLPAQGESRFEVPVNLTLSGKALPAKALRAGLATPHAERERGSRPAPAFLSLPAWGTSRTGSVASESRSRSPLALANPPQCGSRDKIIVKRCNVPFDQAMVSLRVLPKTGAPYSLNAVSAGNGEYFACLPTPSLVQAEVAAFCSALGNVLGIMCDVLQPLMQANAGPFGLCAQIITALAPVPGAQPFIPEVTAGCPLLLGALDLYCSTLGFGPGPGGPGVFDALCDFIEILEVNSRVPMAVAARVEMPGSLGVFGGNFLPVQPAGPFPDLTVEVACVTVAKAGSGQGTVNFTPPSIACGPACTSSTGLFSKFSVVSLSAAPEQGSTFVGWGGDCSGNNLTTSTVATGDNGCVANFIRTPQTLTLLKTGTGDGTVTSVPSGISCGNNCAASFGNGDTITLAAAPNPDSTFAGWGGDCSGAGNTTTVTLNTDKTCFAMFDRQPQITSFDIVLLGGICGNWNMTVTEPSGLTVSFDDPANVVISSNAVRTPSGSIIRRTGNLVKTTRYTSVSLPPAGNYVVTYSFSPFFSTCPACTVNIAANLNLSVPPFFRSEGFAGPACFTGAGTLTGTFTIP